MINRKSIVNYEVIEAIEKVQTLGNERDGLQRRKDVEEKVLKALISQVHAPCIERVKLLESCNPEGEKSELDGWDWPGFLAGNRANCPHCKLAPYEYPPKEEKPVKPRTRKEAVDDKPAD